MFVHCIPRVRVMNQNIVYYDNVIKHDSLGKDLKISCIDKIKENELESCIKYIFKIIRMFFSRLFRKNKKI